MTFVVDARAVPRIFSGEVEMAKYHYSPQLVRLLTTHGKSDQNKTSSLSFCMIFKITDKAT